MNDNAANLSNKALIDQYCEIVDHPVVPAAAEVRLEILHDEINRRYSAGLLTDDDWKLERH